MEILTSIRISEKFCFMRDSQTGSRPCVAVILKKNTLNVCTCRRSGSQWVQNFAKNMSAAPIIAQLMSFLRRIYPYKIAFVIVLLLTKKCKCDELSWAFKSVGLEYCWILKVLTGECWWSDRASSLRTFAMFITAFRRHFTPYILKAEVLIEVSLTNQNHPWEVSSYEGHFFRDIPVRYSPLWVMETVNFHEKVRGEMFSRVTQT